MPHKKRVRFAFVLLVILNLAFGRAGLTATIAARSVFARSAPETSATAVASLFRGQSFLAIARTARADWIEVDHSSGPVWIPAWAATLSGNVLNLPVKVPAGEAASPTAAVPEPVSLSAPQPSLDDFWDGRAEWRLDGVDVGLPIGESDTLVGPDGQLWSYLHASQRSAGIVDSWGAPVEFPGCVTLWKSADGGRTFNLTAPRCLIPCRSKPCTSQADQIEQQQYPRVARSAGGLYVMVYEWQGHTVLRTSAGGLRWSAPQLLRGTGEWLIGGDPCQAWELIHSHPFVDARLEYQCLAGAPPGVFVDGSQLYVFVGLGKNPGHMGCFTGPLASGANGLKDCAANPLFTGAESYGPLTASGSGANAYFDFRTIAAADVLRVGNRYYMTYEGVRGPTGATLNGDSQFGLGLARSLGPQIDGPWEKYSNNPLLRDVSGNFGIGHADLIVLDGVTYLYTATGDFTRGRYALVWK